MGLVVIGILWLAISFQMEGGDNFVVAAGKVLGFLAGAGGLFVASALVLL